MRSNLSVAAPIDLLCYRADSLRAGIRVDIAEADPYFATLRTGYGRGILELFKGLPDPDWVEAVDAAID
jgi:putative proteasome-type protease